MTTQPTNRDPFSDWRPAAGTRRDCGEVELTIPIDRDNYFTITADPDTVAMVPVVLRQLLAQPESEGVTDEEVPYSDPPQWCNTPDMELAWKAGKTLGWQMSQRRYARPTIEPVPVAEDVPHEEILRLAAEEIGYEFTGQWFLTGGKGLTLETNPLELLNFAHAILARWGRPTIRPKGTCQPNGYAYRYPAIDGTITRFNHGQEVNGCRPLYAIPYWLGQPPTAHPTIKPVPVAERLPGPEDCDAEGRCWWLTLAVADGGRGGYSTYWELTTFKAAARCTSHWLPHHALPVPGAEAGHP